MCMLFTSKDPLSFPVQDATVQHHTGYAEEELVPVMQHIAKNVVMVNNSMTKFVVSI